MVILSGALDVENSLLVLDNKLIALETYAVKTKSFKSLPPLSSTPSKRYATQRALFNTVEAAIVRLENLANEIPKASLQVRSHIHAQEIDYDPGARFEKLIGPFYRTLLEATNKISLLTKDFGSAAVIIKKQVISLGIALKATTTLISKAATMAKPQDTKSLREECRELIDSAEEVSDYKHDIDVKSPLRYHAQALADFAADLGWVLSPTCQKHVRSYVGIVKMSTENILASYIELGLNPVHSDFGNALDKMVEELVEYVVKEHPAGLRWNYAKGAVPKGYKKAAQNLTEDSHPFGDYDRVINQSVVQYYCYSQVLGGYVFEQAKSVLAAFSSMSEVIERCSSKQRPTSSVDAELKMVLQPVTHDLVPVVQIAQKCPPDYKFKAHLKAIVEFAQCMQWCTALMHKMSPVAFIIDIDGVVSLCLAEIERGFGENKRKAVARTYKEEVHMQWCASVRKMLKDLKEYVKNHHPNELMFDTQRRRKSLDAIYERTNLNKRIDDLRKKSKARKWERGTIIRSIKGRKTRVKGWEKAS